MAEVIRDGTGSSFDAKVDINNRLYTYGNDNLEISRGNISGVDFVHKFGRNDAISNATWFAAIWNGGSEYSGFSNTTAEILSINSSSADDVSGTGVGAHTLTLPRLLDGDYNMVGVETLELNGTTPVYTSGQYLRCTRAIVNTAGASGLNMGSIVIMPSGAGSINIHASLPVGYNQTMIACDTIPAGKTGFLSDYYVSLAGKTNATVVARLMIRPSGGVFNVKEELSIGGAANSYVQRVYTIPKNTLPEKSDIKIMASSDTNSTSVAAGFDLILIDN